MESQVTFIADNELYVIVVIIGLAYFASHVLEPLVPFFRSDVHWPKPQISFALLRATQTLGQGSIEHIELVVECHLVVLLDVPESENTDADLSKDIPLLGDAVGLAGMVDESSQVALLGGVNDLALAGLHQVSAGGNGVLLDPPPALFGINGENLSDVLHDEIPLLDLLAGIEPPPFASGGKGVHQGILVLLELPIIAQIVASARLIVALSRDHPVDAAIAAVVGDIRVLVYSALENGYLSGSDCGTHRQYYSSSFFGCFRLRSR